MKWYKGLYMGDEARNIYVVGMAKGRMEALGLVRDIIDEVYHNTGGFDISGYLKFGNKR